MARLALGDPAGALADFDRAMASGSPAVAAAALRGRGDARCDLGDYAAPSPITTWRWRSTPAVADAYHGRGGARLALGDFAGAIADYDRALELDPAPRRALISRGNAHYHHRDGRASADYKAAFRLDAEATTRELVGIVVDHGRARPRGRPGELPQAPADRSRRTSWPTPAGA